MHIKAGGKAVIIALVLAGAGFYANKAGYFEGKQTVAATAPAKIDIPTGDAASAPPPSTSVSIAKASSNGVIKVQTIAWNAMAGLSYANGAPNTTAGSLMDKRGLKVSIERQDDYAQMIAQHVAFAQSFAAGNPNPSEGIAFSIIMGDGYPAFAASAASAMGKTGQMLQVVGSLGYSRGEDKCMMPAEVKTNPQKARGVLIAAVPRDGDAHICFKWASDNGIPINPDAKTYDPDAINFVEVKEFTDADSKLIAGYSESRKLVSRGHITNETKNVKVNGTATWTPGDVNVFTQCNKEGSPCKGITTIASTLEYKWQMPAVLIGNKAWMEKNPTIIQNFLAAAFEGGELVRSDDSALLKAGDIQSKIFKEQDAKYWAEHFKGSTKNGASVGGSTTNGLSDNAYLFGLKGNDNLFKRVYTVFGNIDKTYYPLDMPTVPNYDQVVNTFYIEALMSKSTNVAKADVPTYSPTAQVTSTFAKKSYAIEFNSGKTSFTPEAATVLDDLVNQLAVSGLTIQINGHTDAVGNSSSNLSLSKARADAVKSFLMQNAGSSFPSERIRTRGFGDTVPLADNKSAEGRAKNRRVEIILQQTN
jgi:OOP family OmpA-OmpF porin